MAIAMAIVFGILYIIISFIFLFFGIVLVVDNAEYGENDENFRWGRYMLKTWIVWPFCLYRVVKTKIKEAEEVE